MRVVQEFQPDGGKPVQFDIVLHGCSEFRLGGFGCFSFEYLLLLTFRNKGASIVKYNICAKVVSFKAITGASSI